LAANAATSAFPFKQVATAGLSVLMKFSTVVINVLIFEIERWQPSFKTSGAKAITLAALSSSMHGTIAKKYK
jgi:hypothetical protein